MSASAQGGRGRRISATALTAAVVGGLLGGASAAQAAPSPHRDDGTSKGSPDEDVSAQTSLPSVWPRPQSMRAQGSYVPIGREVTLIADEESDRAALDVLRTVLHDAGARTVREVRPGQDSPAGDGLVLRVGTRAADGALRALRAPERGVLPKGGYRLAVGRAAGHDTVALEGADGAGLFNAAQTLRQLVTERHGGKDDKGGKGNKGSKHGKGSAGDSSASGKGFAGAAVRDWPAASVRGVTEGFYGQPWSQDERLAQLDFLGRTKQNRYLYAPGDDPYRQAARWRDPYPAAQRAEFRELAERARSNHVVLGWAVSPGQGLCFSSADDRRALLRKVDAMRALGFGAFQLQFEDVSYSEWHCDADADTYGTGPEAAAKAHADLANAVSRHLTERHPDAAPLSLMPTEYYQKGATDYRTALAGKLDSRVEVAWTGVGVVPRTITGGELAGARAAFRHHPLVTMDNYPVNDWARDRIFLGPYRGREPAVAAGSAGVLANAMEQPTASRIPLFTSADYAWNPHGYAPQAYWRAAIDDLARNGQDGQDSQDAEASAREAVYALAANDASSVLGGKESAYLRPLMDAFWTAYEDAHRRHGDEALQQAGERLRSAFSTMRTARERVPAPLAREVRPWLDQLARHGEAGERAVEMLLAQARGDGAAAWKAQLDVRRLHEHQDAGKGSPTVGKGVLSAFVKRALHTSDNWSGVRNEAPDKHAPHGGHSASGGPAARPGDPLSAAVDGDPATAYRAARTPATGWFSPRESGSGPFPARLPKSAPDAPDSSDSDALTMRLPKPRRLEAVTVQTGPGSGTRARVEVHVPGGRWHHVGALSDSGYSQAGAGGLWADAVRLVWDEGTEPPVVHEITPWYADGPASSLSLSRDEAYAPIGGTASFSARLSTERPADVHGHITADDAPKGFTVHAPRRTTVPRGGSVKVPVEISVADSVRPGTYRVPLDFGDQRRTVTVRAFPRTGGPDLARGAEASSSGDETDDFPASAVNDGKKNTRWSSPAEDGEWVQLKLPKPDRVGQVVLHWQDAYAKRYRVQVSPDGKRWRTAATVRDGRGGKESVRMDSPADTRFLRVQGDERATRFGYSLWSVEAYAVDDQSESPAGKHRRPKHARSAEGSEREQQGKAEQTAYVGPEEQSEQGRKAGKHARIGTASAGGQQGP